jgi:hypothetical protein
MTRSLGVLRNSLCKHGNWAQRTTAHIRKRSERLTKHTERQRLTTLGRVARHFWI